MVFVEDSMRFQDRLLAHSYKGCNFLHSSRYIVVNKDFDKEIEQNSLPYNIDLLFTLDW